MLLCSFYAALLFLCCSALSMLLCSFYAALLFPCCSAVSMLLYTALLFLHCSALSILLFFAKTPFFPSLFFPSLSPDLQPPPRLPPLPSPPLPSPPLPSPPLPSPPLPSPTLPYPSHLQPHAYVLMWLFLKTALQGAQTTIYCAVAKEVEGQNGAYFDSCRMKKPPTLALNGEYCRKLWDYSMKTLKLD